MLVLETDEHLGKIHLEKGTVIHAEIDESKLNPLKSAYRMPSWTHGTSELMPASEAVVQWQSRFKVPQEILMEGLRQQDELQAMQHKLPDKRRGDVYDPFPG